MKPFNSAQDAMDWIQASAHGPVEVYVFDERYVLGGEMVDGEWKFN